MQPFEEQGGTLNRQSVVLARETHCLGHVVSGARVSTDPAKVVAVTESPQPANINELWSFLGLVSYYRKFIRNFATMATPLHQLFHKGQQFDWTWMPVAWEFGAVLAQPGEGRESGGFLQQETKETQETRAELLHHQARANSGGFGSEAFLDYMLGTRFTLRTDHASLICCILISSNRLLYCKSTAVIFVQYTRDPHNFPVPLCSNTWWGCQLRGLVWIY